MNKQAGLVKPLPKCAETQNKGAERKKRTGQNSQPFSLLFSLAHLDQIGFAFSPPRSLRSHQPHCYGKFISIPSLNNLNSTKVPARPNKREPTTLPPLLRIKSKKHSTKLGKGKRFSLYSAYENGNKTRAYWSPAGGGVGAIL